MNSSDTPWQDDERATILQMSALLPGLIRPSEHLLDRTHPEYVSCRSQVDAGVAQLEQLLARMKQLRVA